MRRFQVINRSLWLRLLILSHWTLKWAKGIHRDAVAAAVAVHLMNFPQVWYRSLTVAFPTLRWAEAKYWLWAHDEKQWEQNYLFNLSYHTKAVKPTFNTKVTTCKYAIFLRLLKMLVLNSNFIPYFPSAESTSKAFEILSTFRTNMRSRLSFCLSSKSRGFRVIFSSIFANLSLL